MWIRQPGYAYKQPRRVATRPAGQPFVPPSLTDSGGTGAPQAQQFSLVQIPVPQADILDPEGVVTNPIGLWPRGGVIAHHMDKAIAAGWIAEARHRISIAASTAAAKNPSSGSDLMAAMFAIVQVYNAYNIPWYMDPVARQLWRHYIAGQPQLSTGSSTLPHQFGPYNYNDAWFTAGVPFAGFGEQGRAGTITDKMYGIAVSAYGGPQPVARCPASSMTLGPCFAASNNKRVGLIHTVWPYLEVPDYLSGAGIQIDPVFAARVVNQATLGAGFIDEENRVPDVSMLGTLTHGATLVERVYGPLRSVEVPTGYDIVTCDVASGCIVHPHYGITTQDDWRLFGFDPVTGPLDIGEKRISAAPVLYVPWLDEWIATLERRVAEAVVLSARAYTIYVNRMQSAQYGGDRAFLNTVINLDSFLTDTERSGTQKTAMQAAAAVTAAVGAALAPETYGISGLIGGAAALALDVASTEVRSVPHVGRDEFGRWKPVLERGWLSGDPTVTDASGLPEIRISAPPGWVRPTAGGTPSGDQPIDLFNPASVQAALAKAQQQINRNAAPPVTPTAAAATASTGLGTVAALALGAGAVFAGYKVMTSKKPKTSKR